MVVLAAEHQEELALVEAYAKEQGMWHNPDQEPEFSEHLELDLGTVVPSIAGPKRPQDRILLSSILSVPVDTLAFQHLAGYLTPAAFVTEVASKAVGVAIVWYLLRLRVGNTERSVAA